MTDSIVKGDGVGQLAERVRLTKQGLAVEKEQRRLLSEFVRDCMVHGTDYGEIPGTEKPTLLKPGAEKLVDLFRCTPEVVLEQAVTDFDKPLFYYRFKVRLFSEAAGRVLAEGVGSANSREARYRWRNAARKCPSCGKEAIIQGKEEYGGGWVCFKKKNGCGEKFGTDDKRLAGQSVGRVENEDIADLDNTILKMAKKRALVDGAIALGRCSDIFTQDLEDMPGYEMNPGSAPERTAEHRGAYGPPTGVETDPSAVATQMQSARKQIGAEPMEEERQVIAGRHKGKALANLDDVSLFHAIEDVAAIVNDPANQKKKNYPKATRSYAALTAERDMRKAARKALEANTASTLASELASGEPREAEKATILAGEMALAEPGSAG